MIFVRTIGVILLKHRCALKMKFDLCTYVSEAQLIWMTLADWIVLFFLCVR